MDRIIREPTEIELHPNDMNREDGFCISKSWKPLICCLKDCRNPPSQDLIDGFSIGPRRSFWNADVCMYVCMYTLTSSGHQLCPLWAPNSPKPFLPVPTFLHYFCSLYCSPHACDLRTWLLLYPWFPACHTLTNYLLHVPTYALVAFFRADTSHPCLDSCWFTLLCNGANGNGNGNGELSCAPLGSFCSVSEKMGPNELSYSSLLFAI
jgi:hypothetical protein